MDNLNFTTEIQPNMDFIKELTKTGADALQKCYQCSTCSTVCPLSTDTKPFPRKEMMWAQWGQPDKLVYNSDVWLCHQCNDCVDYCPREAKPGDVMASVRRFSFSFLATPGFMGRALQNIKLLPLLLAVPALLLMVVLMINGSLTEVKRSASGAIVYSNFIPMDYIDVIFIAVASLAVISTIISVLKFWKGMKRERPPADKDRKGILSSIVTTILNVTIHRRFIKCGVNKKRSVAHFMVFWGFVGLFVTTNIVFYYVYGADQAPTSTIQNIFTLDSSLAEPARTDKPLASSAAFVKLVIGNGSALIFILGGLGLMLNRMLTRTKAASTSYDWVFMAMIFLTGVTGWLTQWFRIWDLGVVAYVTYFVHLVFVFYIIAYFPFSKLAHMVYRFVAMVYARYSGHEVELSVEPVNQP